MDIIDEVWNTTELITFPNSTNSTTTTSEPPGFSETSVPLVAAYGVMFVLAAAGNLSVIITLFRSKRHRRSRISLMICHLAVADLIVAFFMIPLEIGWRLTVEWKAGNFACKLFLFLRAFCLYLSSNVLVCVALDRCFAVVYPLRVTDARRRGKTMLLGAWIIAMLNALPQSYFFRVQVHPKYPGFHQCVTFDSFSGNQTLESAYTLFGLIAMYFVPLLIICIAYSAIVCEISNRSNRQHNDGDSGDNEMTNNGTVMLRCSALTQIQRARQRTFRLTITIVLGFVWCWTPYVVMASWYIIDKESASKVNTNVQDGLFLMAVSNSCLNPLIYSTYSMRRCRFPWSRKRCGGEVAGGGAKTELQRRSTGTISRTSVLTKLTNARTNNVQHLNAKNNGIKECDSLRLNSPHKGMLLFDDNGNCHPNYNKHHHSAKNLSNSQLNSVTNTNSRTSRNMSGDSDDLDSVSGVRAASDSGPIRASMSSQSNRNSELSQVQNGKRNSFYCISMGNLPSQSSINFARPSFYSDPPKSCEWDTATGMGGTG